MFSDRWVHMFGLPKEFICDNASIIKSEFLKDLFAMSGVEQHSSVAYQPQSNGRAERTVQSIVNSLRQYLEQRGGSSKHSWERVSKEFFQLFVVPLLLLAAGVGFLLLVFEEESVLLLKYKHPRITQCQR